MLLSHLCRCLDTPSAISSKYMKEMPCMFLILIVEVVSFRMGLCIQYAHYAYSRESVVCIVNIRVVVQIADNGRNRQQTSQFLDRLAS